MGRWGRWGRGEVELMGELLFHGKLLTRLALRGEALITAAIHFSLAVINSECAEDGWMTITLIKTSEASGGRNGALAKIIRFFFFVSIRREKSAAKKRRKKIASHLGLLKLPLSILDIKFQMVCVCVCACKNVLPFKMVLVGKATHWVNLTKDRQQSRCSIKCITIKASITKLIDEAK